MKPLAPPPDSLHLEAAQGWCEHGNHIEAEAELEHITPENRSHPAVLEVRWQIYAKAKQWDAAFYGRQLASMTVFHTLASLARPVLTSL